MTKEALTGSEEVGSQMVLGYLKLVLKLWGDELNARPSDEKRTFTGKLESAKHTQTVDYIKPLFKSLKSKVSLFEFFSTMINHPCMLQCFRP